jgi:hypothetical protein
MRLRRLTAWMYVSVQVAVQFTMQLTRVSRG